METPAIREQDNTDTGIDLEHFDMLVIEALEKRIEFLNIWGMLLSSYRSLLLKAELKGVLL